MKPFNNLLILLLLMSTFLFAQKTINNSSTHNEYLKPAIVLLNNFDKKSNSHLVSSNTIFIEQIGNYNSIISSISSRTSDVNLFQIGSFNDISLSVSSINISDFVLQYGNNNSFSITSFNTSDFHDIEVIQRGDNQNLTWLGDNLISEKLKITMQGYSKSIIVKNYK